MILHVDMDAFFASVEQRDRPELRGRPVIVGGSAESRGVVSAASYEARKFGVHSAMPAAVARRLCPHGVFLPVRMEHYATISRQIREIMESFTPLVDHFGDLGEHFWQLAHGLDDRPVVPDWEAKSISTETTFAQDIADRDVLRSWLLELADQVAGRLRRARVRARTVEIKVRSSDFRTHSRSLRLAEPTDLTDVVWRAAADLFDRRIADSLLPARLVGVGATGLERETAVQRHLFDEAARTKQRAADQASDGIRQRFGEEAIRRAGVLHRPPEKS